MALSIAPLNARYLEDEEELKCFCCGGGWDGWPECVISIGLAMIRIWPEMSLVHDVAMVT